MQQPLKLTCQGSYVNTSEGLDRAKELSRAALRKLLDSMPADDNLGDSGTATGSPTFD